MSLQVGAFGFQLPNRTIYIPRISKPLFEQEILGGTNRPISYNKDRIEKDTFNNSSFPRQRLYRVVYLATIRGYKDDRLSFDKKRTT
jgi:hypothetical protein